MNFEKSQINLQDKYDLEKSFENIHINMLMFHPQGCIAGFAWLCDASKRLIVVMLLPEGKQHGVELVEEDDPQQAMDTPA